MTADYFVYGHQVPTYKGVRYREIAAEYIPATLLPLSLARIESKNPRDDPGRQPVSRSTICITNCTAWLDTNPDVAVIARTHSLPTKACPFYKVYIKDSSARSSSSAVQRWAHVCPCQPCGRVEIVYVLARGARRDEAKPGRLWDKSG